MVIKSEFGHPRFCCCCCFKWHCACIEFLVEAFHFAERSGFLELCAIRVKLMIYSCSILGQSCRAIYHRTFHHRTIHHRMNGGYFGRDLILIPFLCSVLLYIHGRPLDFYTAPFLCRHCVYLPGCMLSLIHI